MARPRKASEEKRDDRLNPRLTPAERAEIERHAAALGITPSDGIVTVTGSGGVPGGGQDWRHEVAT